MKNINEPTDGKCGYVACFNRESVGVYADSRYGAEQLALAHFKPKKRDAWMLSVYLAEVDGTQVTTTLD